MSDQNHGDQTALERALEPFLKRLDKIDERIEEIRRALQLRETLIKGWVAIAKEAGLSYTHARRLSRREVDPLPVYRRHGINIAIASELRAWRARHTRLLSSK